MLILCHTTTHVTKALLVLDEVGRIVDIQKWEATYIYIAVGVVVLFLRCSFPSQLLAVQMRIDLPHFMKTSSSRLFANTTAQNTPAMTTAYPSVKIQSNR